MLEYVESSIAFQKQPIADNAGAQPRLAPRTQISRLPAAILEERLRLPFGKILNEGKGLEDRGLASTVGSDQYQQIIGKTQVEILPAI